MLLSARIHNKLAFESKPKVLRDIYNRLREANSRESFDRLCSKTFVIYGNGECSAFERATGFTRPMCSAKSHVIVPEEVLDAQNELTAKRKLNLILRSKSVRTPKFEVGDIVQVFIKNTSEKRGKWSSPKTVFDFNPQCGIITLPGKGDRVLKVSAEDVRYALSSPFTYDIRRANDELDLLIDDALVSEEDADGHNIRDESQIPGDGFLADLNSHTRRT